MRLKHLLFATLTALLVLPAPAQVLPLRSKLETPGSFSMILRPNPQGYVKFDTNQPLFELTTGRIRTFSPLSAVSALTCDHTWRTAPYDQFDITLE